MGCLADTVGVQGVGDLIFKVQPQNYHTKPDIHPWLSTLSLETIATPITVNYTARLAGLLYPIDITDIMAHLHF